MIKYNLINDDVIRGLKTIDDNSVDLVVTSPPYNCRKDYGDFDDMMPWADYYLWMEDVIQHIYRVLIRGGVVAINVPGVVRWQTKHLYADSWSDYDEKYKTHRYGKKVQGIGRIEPIGFNIFSMMKNVDNHLREPIIWVKGNEKGAISTEYKMGSDNNPYLRPTHEFILLGSKEQWYHRGGTGRRGKDYVPFLEETKDCWFISPTSSKIHPAIFPKEIPARLIKLFTHADDAVILDPFMGIGTSGIVAMELGKKFIGIEQNKKYFTEAERNIFSVASQMRLEME